MIKLQHGCGLLVFCVGVCLATAPPSSSRSDSFSQEREGRIRESRASSALAPEQRARVQRAIDAIRTGPPARIILRDSSGVADTMLTAGIARGLQKQLDDGRIKVDSSLSAHDYAISTTDGRVTDAADEVDFHKDVLSGADSLFLQEVLVHEYRHKVQVNGSEAADEVEAYSLELSYKDSLGLDSTNTHYRECRDNLAAFQAAADDAGLPRERRRSAMVEAAGRYWQLVAGDPVAGVACHLQSRLLSHPDWTAHPPLLAGLVDASELLLLDTPDGGTLLACGVTPFGAGALVALRVTPLGAVTEQLLLLRPGENLRRMTLLPEAGSVAVLNVTLQRVRRYFDSNGDGVPDAQGALMAQLDPMGSWRRLDWAWHPVRGPGLLIGSKDRLFSHLRRLNEPLLFLQDMDGDGSFELSHAVQAHEFLKRVPVVQEPYPLPGESLVLLSGTWGHEIQLHRTSATGQPLELLGSVVLTAPEALLALDQALTLGEYIRPYDVQADLWQGRTIRVGGELEPPAAPQNLHLAIERAGNVWTLLLTWDPVPGVLYYRVEADPGTGEWLPFADVSGTQHAWTLPANGLPPRTLFRVRAVN